MLLLGCSNSSGSATAETAVSGVVFARPAYILQGKILGSSHSTHFPSKISIQVVLGFVLLLGCSNSSGSATAETAVSGVVFARPAYILQGKILGSSHSTHFPSKISIQVVLGFLLRMGCSKLIW